MVQSKEDPPVPRPPTAEPVDLSKVCLATVEEFLGCVHGCRNAATVLGTSWAVIPNRGEIPAAVFQCGLLILSSWHERYEAVLEGRRGPTVPRWHSTILQSELAQEQWKIVRIMELFDQGAFPGLAVCDPEFRTMLGREGIVFFPDQLAWSEYHGVTPTKLGGVNVSLFGERHWRKNILVQAVAFDRARRAAGAADWTLHLNGQTTHREGYGEWLEAARIPFVDHCRMERSRYLALVAAMDVGLCATLSESYCYVAADHVAQGVPIVASPTIACLDDGVPRARPESVDDVAGALSRALADRSSLAVRQRQALEAQAQANVEIGRAAILELLERAQLSLVP